MNISATTWTKPKTTIQVLSILNKAYRVAAQDDYIPLQAQFVLEKLARKVIKQEVTKRDTQKIIQDLVNQAKLGVI